MRKLILLFISMAFAMSINAQVAKVYDESRDQMAQIDSALNVAKAANKFVICQVGGNWCPWCLRFADFITKDTAVTKVIGDNYVYTHVNYHPRKAAPAGMMQRLGNPQRFGFPVLVVLDANGRVIHIQDSGFLEEGKGYSHDKVLKFFESWTPRAVSSN